MSTPLATDTLLAVDHAGPDGAALQFRFEAAGEPAPVVHCPALAGPATEAWRTRGGRYRLLALVQPEHDGDIEAAAADAYARLLAEVRPSGHPYLIRIWNYFAGINAGEGDAERYRRFCVGRARAVDGMFNDPPPAATAIGTVGVPGRLQVVALCADGPAVALENPRQTPAWRYPRDYGPVAPGFSRGALLDADGPRPRVLASGTASIVGHVSLHPGNAAEQLRESLRNLETLLAEARGKCGRAFRLSDCEALRVYLRRADDLATVQSVLADSGIPPARASLLRGDVCRRELEVELEGVFPASD